MSSSASPGKPASERSGLRHFFSKLTAVMSLTPHPLTCCCLLSLQLPEVHHQGLRVRGGGWQPSCAGVYACSSVISCICACMRYAYAFVWRGEGASHAPLLKVPNTQVTCRPSVLHGAGSASLSPREPLASCPWSSLADAVCAACLATGGGRSSAEQVWGLLELEQRLQFL